jgi:hypothetical protein
VWHARRRFGEGKLEGADDSRASVLSKTAWMSLAIIGVAILVFGLVVTVVPGSGDPPYLRTIGVASIGMGTFGLLITTMAFRRCERWAWFALWYYPAFWTAHLVGGLPPGKEHVHQVVFIVLSVVGLLLPVREFFPRRGGRASTTERRFQPPSSSENPLGPKFAELPFYALGCIHIKGRQSAKLGPKVRSSTTAGEEQRSKANGSVRSR